MTHEQGQEILRMLREIRNDCMSLSERIQSLVNYVQILTSNTVETTIEQGKGENA